MLVWVTDAVNKNKVAVNPVYVVVVFQVPEGEHIGKTAINLTTGSIIVEENDLDVIGMINGELK
jgi:hypothetical protein